MIMPGLSVKMLIEELLKMPPDLEVRAEDGEHEGPITSVRQVKIIPKSKEGYVNIIEEVEAGGDYVELSVF